MAAVSGKLLPRKIADIPKAYCLRHWFEPGLWFPKFAVRTAVGQHVAVVYVGGTAGFGGPLWSLTVVVVAAMSMVGGGAQRQW